MSINVSPIQLKKINFVDFLINACNENKVPYNFLTIEITEGTLIDLNKYDVEILNKIIVNGFKIAVDDFGTGYSSLKYLAMLPINTLKIDKSFINNINIEKNLAVVKCILDLSRVLKYNVIAEGVETKDQMDILLKIGCSLVQGFYFSKPVYETEVIEVLEKYNI